MGILRSNWGEERGEGGREQGTGGEGSVGLLTDWASGSGEGQKGLKGGPARLAGERKKS